MNRILTPRRMTYQGGAAGEEDFMLAGQSNSMYI
jgi:hypothetical protein